MIKIGKNISEFSIYSCQPNTVDELRNIIRSRIAQQGYNCDLNDIDISFDHRYVLSVRLFDVHW